MKRYTVLRNNLEFGPYGKEELDFYGLTAGDLVWVEGESTCWQSAEEITELNALVTQGIIHAFPALHPVTSITTSSIHGSNSFVTSDTAFNQSPKRKRSKRKRLVSFGTLAGYSIVLGVIFLCGLFLIRMVSGFNQTYTAAVEAKGIAEEVVAMSASSHEGKGLLPLAERSITNDTVAKKVSPDATLVIKQVPFKAVKKTPSKEEMIAPKETETIANTDLVDGEKEQIEKAPKELPESNAATVEVSANDYKVGLFGGISNLELTVSNPSSKPVDKIVINVEFLKPNGNTIKSQTVSVENIAPSDAKTIAVPPSNRGVKVRYTVINTSSITN